MLKVMTTMMITMIVMMTKSGLHVASLRAIKGRKCQQLQFSSLRIW